MEKIPEEYAGAFKGMGLSERRRLENAEKSPLSELYQTMLECSGFQDTAAELEAEMKLEAAVKNNSPAKIIMDLAAGCSGAGKEAGFIMGFRTATRLFVEGMKGIGF